MLLIESAPEVAGVLISGLAVVHGGVIVDVARLHLLALDLPEATNGPGAQYSDSVGRLPKKPSLEQF